MIDGANKKKEILLVYDRECPACDRYVQLTNIRRSVGELKIVNAREPGPVVSDITRAGVDLNQGIVLLVGEQMYHGGDAMHVLAMLGTKRGLFNRVNYFLFRSKTMSRALYPVFRAGRGLLLKLLGIKKIENLK